MDSQPWLDRVRERLARQALPPTYVQRFVEELTDHFEDLKEENMEADAIARLGEPEQVAEAAIAAYRRRSFFGRYPAATFLIFAISPVIPLIFVLSAFSSVTLTATNGTPGGELFIEQRWLLSLILALSSTITGTLYGELAMWLGIGRRWTLTSCAAMGAVIMVQEFLIGSHTVMLLVQFAVPFAVGWWFIKRERERRYVATKVVVFAISPVLALMILSCVVSLAMRPITHWVTGSQAAMRLSPAAFSAALYSSHLLKHAIPTAVASLLYCELAKRFGLGRSWIFIFFMVIVTFGTMELSNSAIYYWRQHSGRLIPLTTCNILTDCIVPLAIGWWFLRRKHHRGELQLAS